MSRLLHRCCLEVIGGIGLLIVAVSPAHAQPENLEADVRAAAARFVKAFDAADVESLVKQFSVEGELIDEQGVTYRGRDEIKQLFERYFGRFAGTRLTLDIESVRSIGPGLAIEEGTRLLTRDNNGGSAQLRYVTVRSRVDGEWVISSLREFADDPAPTPNDFLQSLAWLIGDWVNEGGDATVRISYRWTEDKNYILADFHILRADQTVTKSSQRIGWDPQAQKIRSWLFEADGSFSEGRWTPVDYADDGSALAWLVKSTGTLADGQSGSATLRYTRVAADRFQIEGRDRVIGDETGEDFSVIVVRRPPSADVEAVGKPATSEKK